jgi:hypothetical protein
MIGLDTTATFIFDFVGNFLLEVPTANGFEYFVWSDPDYGNGDNTIRPYHQSTLVKRHGKPENFWGRDKGRHTIGGYCGDQVKFVNCGDSK